MARKKLTEAIPSIVSSVEDLEGFVKGVYHDAEKFDKGNQAAGSRVRKAMQEIKKKAQDIRVLIQEIKNNR